MSQKYLSLITGLAAAVISGRYLKKKKHRLRQRIFDVEDEIMEKRDSLIDALEKRMQQRTENDALFTVRWQVV